MKKSESVSHSVVPNSLWPHGLSPARLLCPWNSPVKNTGGGCYSLLQRIFPTQGSNPGLLHCRQIHYLLLLYQLSHQESARILEWVAFPFSSRSSQNRNWTGVSCITGRFFTNWAVREALIGFCHSDRNRIGWCSYIYTKKNPSFFCFAFWRVI